MGVLNKHWNSEPCCPFHDSFSPFSNPKPSLTLISYKIPGAAAKVNNNTPWTREGNSLTYPPTHMYQPPMDKYGFQNHWNNWQMEIFPVFFFFFSFFRFGWEQKEEKKSECKSTSSIYAKSSCSEENNNICWESLIERLS